MAALASPARDRRIETVTGAVPPSSLGITLIHEHILVDFVGADQVSASRYDREEVIRAAVPKFNELKARGCRSFVDCTPAWLGRDPLLLRELARRTGVRIITNTGYYGAADDKFLPKHAFSESAEALAARWIREANSGLDGTSVRPGFVKLGVDPGHLSSVDRKLIRAGAICNLRTGLRLHVHTGPAVAAMDILEELRAAGVSPSEYVWVHAQNERARDFHIKAARMGAWVEFDGIGPKSVEAHASAVSDMKDAGLLRQVLISQDSGWYHVGEPGGGEFKGYTFLFDAFVPALLAKGFTETDVQQLLVWNPTRVLSKAG